MWTFINDYEIGSKCGNIRIIPCEYYERFGVYLGKKFVGTFDNINKAKSAGERLLINIGKVLT